MTILLLDLESAPPAELARRLDDALRADGFVAVTGHGVPADVVAAAFDASRRFFALPEAVKCRWHIDRWPLHRGFDPVGWQALDPNRPADLKESFYLGVEALGPNQWPDEALVPGFRAALDAYAAALRTLAARMMGLFELALSLPPRHFDVYTRRPNCVTRLLHYPPAPAVVLPGQLGCGAHTDWGALTLLVQDDAGGLQVQRADGRWLDVEPVPGAFVVNIGDMTRRWTNDRWRSTMHRVVPRRVGIERWSIAYFFDLDADALVAPLPTCVDAAHPARYAPITAGEHLAEMYRRTTLSG